MMHRVEAVVASGSGADTLRWVTRQVAVAVALTALLLPMTALMAGVGPRSRALPRRRRLGVEAGLQAEGRSRASWLLEE
jgi:hypothetical protein